MERITYELIDLSGKRTLMSDRKMLQAKLMKMREKNCGYYVYELTETDQEKRRRFTKGWSPKA